MHSIPGLYYREIERKGRGVFCANAINEGDLIEICPVIVIDEEDLNIIHSTVLHDYYFQWGKQSKQGALALGLGSLYNHSDRPNARFIPDFANQTIDFIASKFIPEGDEITIDYHEGIRKSSELWFDVVE